MSDFQLSKTLSCPNVFSVHLDSGHQAGIDCKTAAKDGASAALTYTATLFSPRQSQLIAKNIQRPLVGIHHQFQMFSVDFAVDWNSVQENTSISMRSRLHTSLVTGCL